MGASTTRMTETMATLRTLAEENLDTLKRNNWKDEEDTLRMNERIRQINDLVKTMNFDWDYIPKEWDDEKKAFIDYMRKPKT